MKLTVRDRMMRYLHFSQRDMRGFAIWGVLILSVLGLKIFCPPLRREYLLKRIGINQVPLLLKATAWAQQGSYKTASADSSFYKNNRSHFPPRTPYTSPYRKNTFSVEINTGDTLDFQELRGIGAAYARRIVAYRDRLGGFVHMEQLREVYGIDSLLYELIKPKLLLDVSKIHFLAINIYPLQELKKHPYLDYYQAKEIIKHRQKYGPFLSTSDLKRVNLIDEETFRRLQPYISLSTDSSALQK